MIEVMYYGFTSDVCVSFLLSVSRTSVCLSIFRFQMIMSKHPWIFTKLGTCIDIVEIWFGIANGQFFVKILMVTCRAGLGGSVGCAVRLETRRSRVQHSFVEINHEIFSTIILSLPLIQEAQLSVSGERMCTILVHTCHISHCETKSHRMTILQPVSHMNFKSQRIFRPSKRIFYEELIINYTILYF